MALLGAAPVHVGGQFAALWWPVWTRAVAWHVDGLVHHAVLAFRPAPRHSLLGGLALKVTDLNTSRVILYSQSQHFLINFCYWSTVWSEYLTDYTNFTDHLLANMEVPTLSFQQQEQPASQSWELSYCDGKFRHWLPVLHLTQMITCRAHWRLRLLWGTERDVGGVPRPSQYCVVPLLCVAAQISRLVTPTDGTREHARPTQSSIYYKKYIQLY